MRFDDSFFDAGIDRKKTGCEKWDDPQVLPEGAIPMWIADMDFACSPAVAQAVRNRAEHPCFGYSSDTPGKACAEALCAFWQERHGLRFSPEESEMLPCVVTGLKLCVRLFTQKGDKVAIFAPVYGPFYHSVLKNGRQVVSVPLERDARGRYPMNLGGMEEALKNGARMIMLCNPHNPLSRLWTREELEGLCDLAERYDVKIVSDEIHADFVYAPGKFTPVLSLAKAKDRAIMLCSASKTFNIAGLQQAAAVALNRDILDAVRKEVDAAGIECGNIFALSATQAAYREGAAWLDGLIGYLDGNRRALEAFVKERLPKARMAPVEATFLAWLDLNGYGFTCRELKERCEKRGVVFTAGDFFGPEGEGCLRVNFGCPRRQLLAAMEQLCEALKEE